MKKLEALPPRAGDTTGWRERHNEAVARPTGVERPIVALINTWIDYAQAHEKAYESSIGEDGVLGPQWAKIGAALRMLLNGDLRRLDGGTLDKCIGDALHDAGFNPDEL